jgi:hypothetical protein
MEETADHLTASPRAAGGIKHILSFYIRFKNISGGGGEFDDEWRSSR